MIAKQKLGKRFLSVQGYRYGTQRQIEVRSKATRYDGTQYYKREACYAEE